MYEEFRNKTNYQAINDTQINKIIAAQQRRYDPSLLHDTYTQNPKSLYQQYLKQNDGVKRNNHKIGSRRKIYF